MEIAVNDAREIIGFALVGHINNAIEISEEEVPNEFFDDYEPNKYIYDEYEGIIINSNFEPPNTELIDNLDDIKNLEDAKRKIEELEKENEHLKEEFNDLKNKVDKIIPNKE